MYVCSLELIARSCWTDGFPMATGKVREILILIHFLLTQKKTTIDYNMIHLVEMLERRTLMVMGKMILANIMVQLLIWVPMNLPFRHHQVLYCFRKIQR